MDEPTGTGRESVAAAIKLDPYATVRELGRLSGLAPGTVQHHLSAMQADGVLTFDTCRTCHRTRRWRVRKGAVHG